jgi:hypothetical protein
MRTEQRSKPLRSPNRSTERAAPLSGAAQLRELRADEVKWGRMELRRAQLAIAELVRRRSVEKLLRLNGVRACPELATDHDYQRAFKGYYRMGRRSAAFYDAFFAILHDCASAPESQERPTLEEVLKSLHDKTKQKHLSFGSKLLATVDDSAIIFDRNVASYFGVSSMALPSDGWIEEALRRYNEIRRGILFFTNEAEWPAIRDLFDKSIPDAQHLPDARKADLIIWADYAA